MTKERIGSQTREEIQRLESDIRGKKKSALKIKK